MTTQQRSILVRVSGHDRPGITAGLLHVLATAGLDIYDMEQVVVRGRLTLDVLVGVSEDDQVFKELLYWAFRTDVQVEFEVVEDQPTPALPRFAVTVIGTPVGPGALEAVAQAIADGGGNIDRIVRLARYPVVAFELVVVGGDMDAMRAALLAASRTHSVDVAIQREGLERRAKRLVVMDVDSTLIQDEVIELLAEEAGRLDEVRELTARAMAGELDFEASLRARAACLKGTPVSAYDRVRARLRLTPGARTFVRTLRRLGYEVALVSGGFLPIVAELARELGVQHVAANELEAEGGVLTGELVGEIIDRAGKARVLRAIAQRTGVAPEQTVAVGDGANDLDMLAAAGLGIAFNAKPAVREAADTALSVPYLDAVLFLLGIRRDEVEDDDPALAAHIPVAGTPPL